MTPGRILLLAAFVLCSAGCGREEAPAATAQARNDPRPEPDSPQAASPEDLVEDLVDEAADRGLLYRNRSGAPEKATILEANGAGVALLDLEEDGDLDAVFAQGLGNLAELETGPGADLEIWRNDGSGRFARAPGPGLAGWWNGLATGDVDGDGDIDLAASGFGDLALLLQDAHGNLVPHRSAGLLPADPDARLEVGSLREPGKPPMWPTSLALFDADLDGNLDLYVCQYLDLDPADPPIGALGEGALAVPCRWKGYEVFCGPAGLVPQPDRILRGLGNGTFEDVSAEWLPGQVPSPALGVAPFDADGDGDTDLYVANDGMANLLWINDGRGVFTDRAHAAGVALSADGRALAGMGVAAADVNCDGLPDLAVTNFSDEPTEIFFGSQRGFVDMTYRTGLHAATRAMLKWGVHLQDFDGDGWLEIFTANGHVYPQADREHTGTSYGQPAALWRLGPADRAERVEPANARSILSPAAGSRGSAVGDVDLDGAPDLVLARIDGPAALGMNRFGRTNHRLAIRCLGPQVPGSNASAPRTPRDGQRRTPRDGMGARVAVVVGRGAGEAGLLAEVQTAVGYQSASTPWLHFGLGPEKEYRSIRLAWPSGQVTDLPGGKAGRRITIREGQGIVADEVFR